MGLEEIEEIRADIKKLTDERELNIKEALNSISEIKTKYNALLQKKGREYCAKNCSDIPTNINKLLQELTEYNS